MNKRRVRAALDNAVPAAPPPAGGGGGPPPPPTVPAFLLKRFKVNEEGVWRELKEDGAPMWVCARLEAVAETTDEDGLFGLQLFWRDRDGRSRREVFPREQFAGDAGELRSTLAARGLTMNNYREARAAFTEYLNLISSPERARVVARTGWHTIAGRLVYVMADQVFGKPASPVILQTPSREPNLFQQAGTLAGWRETIGRACIENPRLGLAVSMAFAAPLLHLVGEDGGGVHLYGPAKCGKTTCGVAAASVCGGDLPSGGAKAVMRTWRSTANSTEAIAALHSDIGLVQDELGQCDARSVGETVYMLSNGVGRSRMGRDASLRSTIRFRSLYLSTGEMTLAAKMAEANMQVKAGQGVRLVDVSADEGVGLGAFGELHGAESFLAFIAEIREAASRNFGTPIRAFLTFLADRMARDASFAEFLRDEIDRITKAWLADLGAVEGQVRTVARRFALIALGGNLATDAGCTGWGATTTGQREAEWAAERCFRSWLGDRGGNVGQAEDAQAVAQLRAFISRNGSSRFEDWREAKQDAAAQVELDVSPPNERFRTVSRAGWRKWVQTPESGEWRYYLTADGMQEALAGLEYKAALKVLVARGMIFPGAGAESSKPMRIPGAGRQRVYECPASVMSAGTEPPKSSEV